jgi:Flp pilus assembly protein TadD
LGESLRHSESAATAVGGKLFAYQPIVEFERHLLAASGYAELDMTRESMSELNAIPDEHRERPEVLQIRLHNLMRHKRWSQALRVSQKLCRIVPDCCIGFLHASFCLHELGKTAQAKKLLLQGPPLLLKEPIYYYNMGCYDARLGNVGDAQLHLQTSFEMDSSFRELAKKDPDLKALQEFI